MDPNLVSIALCLLTQVVPILYACDPETQYVKGDECCKMCGPGTRMSKSNRGCQDPQCEPCPLNEYQSAYTKNERCTQQPYCDPHKKFERESGPSDTRRISCRCKAGYHCAKANCLFCLPHSPCGLGEGVVSRGNRTHDTVCTACPPNTFSNETSAESECVKHTDCGRNLKEKGTATSNTVCGILAGDIAALVVLIVLGFIIVVAFLVWKYALPEATRGKVQVFFMKTCGKTEKEKPEDEIPGQRLIEQDARPEPPKPEPEPPIPEPETPAPEPETPEPETPEPWAQPAYTSVPEENAEEERSEQDEHIGYPTEETGRKPFITHPQSQMNSLASMV